MKITETRICVEVAAKHTLPRERRRELYRAIKEAGLGGRHYFQLTPAGRKKAEVLRDGLVVKAAAAGFDLGELHVYCGESFGMSF